MNSFHTSPDLFLNLNNLNQLIERENTYNLSRKLLTVHANDRDVMYHPNSNDFSIKCPQSYTNVQSMRLSEISFPSPIYNFSEKLNNNTFFIGLSTSTMKLVTIPDGFYNPTELADAMTYHINLAFGFNSHKFKVIYNTQQSKFVIHNTSSFFIQQGDPSCNNNNFTYNYKEPLDKNSLPKNTNLLNLGFLYNIGFDSDKSTPILSQEINLIKNIILSDIIADQMTTTGSGIEYPTIPIYACASSNVARFRNRQPIYLEIDRYNLYDELNPYPKGSSNLYNNYSNSSTNTAFIKLQPPSTIDKSNYSVLFDNTNNVIIFFDPPLQRLQNLKFKFRYHDGLLVDLNNQDVNFTLEINQLRNEIPKHLNIRTPAL